MTKRIGVIVAIILILVGIYALTQLIPTQLREVKIGVILPLTGKGANYGEKTKVGIDIALEDLEKEREISKISLIYEDSQGDPKTAVAAINKLINTDKVVAIMGPVFSDNVLASAPIAEKKKVIMLVTAAASDKIRDAGDFIFRNRVSASGISTYLARYSYDTLGIDNIAVAYENSANAIDYKNAFVDEFNKKDGKIQIIESFEKGGNDFRAQITKFRQIQPNAVFITGHAQEIGFFLKQAKELGLKTRFISTPGAESDTLLKIAGDAAEGLLLCSEALELTSKDPLIQGFRAKYKERMKQQEPDFFSANGYDSLKMIIESGGKYGFTSEGIKKGLYELKDFHGVGGEITFDSYGEVTKPLSIKIVKDGRFILFQGYGDK